MQPLYLMFKEALSKTEEALKAVEEAPPEKKGYVHLQKVTITPTRMIFEAPELIMGNRILRASPNYPPYKFLRASFCDDNFGRIQSYIGAKLIDKFVLHPLTDGINIAGEFFGMALKIV